MQQSFKTIIVKLLKKIYRFPFILLTNYRIYISDRPALKKKLLDKQADFFIKNNLDRDAGVHLINQTCMNLFNKEYSEDDGMFSEHLVMFSSISISSAFQVNKILEIGTFDGRTAAIFSNLFANADITTIDLEDDSDMFIETYSRSQNYRDFNYDRDSLLSNFQNVVFKRLNSINLFEWDADSFDLIWIDGAHGYPVIAMDIINSLRLISPGGVIMIDDVFTSNKENNQMYRSIGAYESLVSLKEAKSIDRFDLFLKRTGPKHNIKNSQKFVGFIYL